MAPRNTGRDHHRIPCADLDWCRFGSPHSRGLPLDPDTLLHALRPDRRSADTTWEAYTICVRVLHPALPPALRIALSEPSLNWLGETSPVSSSSALALQNVEGNVVRPARALLTDLM